jgi:hypothetical protein
MRVAADYDIALRTVAKGVTEQFRIEHSPAGVERLIERCLALEPDPPEIRVVLDTRHAPWMKHCSTARSPATTNALA